MPTNLNALIRYKQIDRCLRNRFIKCTIQKLQEVCTDALAEYQGVDKMVSERTIRNDIRVMRSADILGFNAPIVFEDGRYYYSDPDYSIFSVPISEKKLLEEIFDLFISNIDSFKFNEVTKLLKQISTITGKKIPIRLKEEDANSEELTKPKIVDRLDLQFKEDENVESCRISSEEEDHPVKLKASFDIDLTPKIDLSSIIKEKQERVINNSVKWKEVLNVI